MEDVGKFVRVNLKSTHNLKAIFKSICNYIAANTMGATCGEVFRPADSQYHFLQDI
jgi:type I restriction enzyme M protein